GAVGWRKGRELAWLPSFQWAAFRFAFARQPRPRAGSVRSPCPISLWKFYVSTAASNLNYESHSGLESLPPKRLCSPPQRAGRSRPIPSVRHGPGRQQNSASTFPFTPYASQLIAAGVPITEIAHRLGHAAPTPTLSTYSH